MNIFYVIDVNGYFVDMKIVDVICKDNLLLGVYVVLLVFEVGCVLDVFLFFKFIKILECIL